MGRACQEKVYKKLINKYLKFNIRRDMFNSEKEFLPKLISSYTSNGVNHPESMKIKKQMEDALNGDNEMFKKLKTEIRTYPSIVSNYTFHTRHKGTKKGRHHIRSDFYQELDKEKERLDF